MLRANFVPRWLIEHVSDDVDDAVVDGARACLALHSGREILVVLQHVAHNFLRRKEFLVLTTIELEEFPDPHKDMLLVERIVHADAPPNRSHDEVFARRLCVNIYNFVSRREKDAITCMSHGTAAGEALRPRCLFE